MQTLPMSDRPSQLRITVSAITCFPRLAVRGAALSVYDKRAKSNVIGRVVVPEQACAVVAESCASLPDLPKMVDLKRPTCAASSLAVKNQ
jgi:hypothetical protein